MEMRKNNTTNKKKDQNENKNVNVNKNERICLNVGHDKGGGDVHLEDHAQHLDDDGDASVSVLMTRVN